VRRGHLELAVVWASVAVIGTVALVVTWDRLPLWGRIGAIGVLGAIALLALARPARPSSGLGANARRQGLVEDRDDQGEGDRPRPAGGDDPAP